MIRVGFERDTGDPFEATTNRLLWRLLNETSLK